MVDYDDGLAKKQNIEFDVSSIKSEPVPSSRPVLRPNTRNIILLVLVAYCSVTYNISSI